jgi:hypothetical protein
MTAKLITLMFALLISGAAAHGAEVFVFRGFWHEDEKCSTIKGDPWSIGSFIMTPKPEGNIIDGIGDLAITRYEFGCKISDPRVAIGNKVRFRALCEGGSEKRSRGQVLFEFMRPNKMSVTFPFMVGRLKTLVLYRCANLSMAVIVIAGYPEPGTN